MALYSDNPLQFNKDLLDAMGTALVEIYSAGGAIKVKKGDFFAEYITPRQIQDDMSRLKTTIHFQENGCKRRCD